MNKLFLIFFCALFFVPLSVAAQSAQGDAGAPTEEKRQLINAVSKNVPIEIKLLDEQRFEDIKNKDWARDLKIEVKNTGNKPIYFMAMSIFMPDVFLFGTELSLDLRYGRGDLLHLTTPTETGDLPILPGHNAILTIYNSHLRMYEIERVRQHMANPRTLRLNLLLINFGDGTGLVGNDGARIPHPIKNH